MRITLEIAASILLELRTHIPMTSQGGLAGITSTGPAQIAVRTENVAAFIVLADASSIACIAALRHSPHRLAGGEVRSDPPVQILHRRIAADAGSAIE